MQEPAHEKATPQTHCPFRASALTSQPMLCIRSQKTKRATQKLMPGPSPGAGYEVGVREGPKERRPVIWCVEIASDADESKDLVWDVDECEGL